MKMPRQLGLIVEGNSTKSAILRYPGLADSIGPIKASVLSVAHRVSNFIRAGDAIHDYEDLGNCDLVLIRVPDASVPRIVDELCVSALPMSGISFLLCESWLSSESPFPAQSAGCDSSYSAGGASAIEPVVRPRRAVCGGEAIEAAAQQR